MNQAPPSVLVERLTSYSIVNSLYQTYGNVKEASPLLKYGLETAESLTTPVLTKLDTTLGLQQKGNQVLDTIEGSVSAANKLYQEKVVVANKQVNQLLDLAEAVVDTVLPPAMEFEYQEVTGDSSSEEERDKEAERLEANPLPRMTAIGLGVPKRIKVATLSKIRTIDLANPLQTESLGYVVDLVQYAADYIDIEQKKQVLHNTTDNVLESIGTLNTNYVLPIKEILDKHTEDVKVVGIKTVVGIVAAIAQAIEVVRRQLLRRLGSREQLQEELANLAVSAKKAISAMNEQELIAYIEVVRENSYSALSKIVDLLNSYAPAPIVQQLPSLATWTESINQRLAKASKDLAQPEAPVTQEAKLHTD
jgi:hypothetical protein